jgi:thiol-disulfide isomerase/thioredoxin
MTFPLTRDELRIYLEHTDKDTTIIKLTASWCGPCQKVKSTIKTLNEQYTQKGISFEYIEIDVDEALDLYSFFKRMKMAVGIPTFLTFKKELFTPDHFYVPHRCFTGADPNLVKAFYAESLLLPQ